MAGLATVTLEEGRDPERSVIDVAGHIAQMSMHASAFFGHQQWYLFDDLWAAAHPELAASLIATPPAGVRTPERGHAARKSCTAPWPGVGQATAEGVSGASAAVTSCRARHAQFTGTGGGTPARRESE
jgi:hypothetical protein